MCKKRDILRFTYGRLAAREWGSPLACRISFRTGSQVFMQLLTPLQHLGRSAQNMLAFAGALRGTGAGLRALKFGGGDVGPHTP